ncbi:4-phosphoerythronate dehydrogenase [Glaciecola siphonariae]|uniref:Erythronate-4-phosphate dehydrogenase n=1 Tax=Glaciecola siphonariae TaxID=521012 RepID=A0ABV9LU76_9ALTE
MNILYDDNMPYAKEYFRGLGQALPFTAGALDNTLLANCEALLVRSTTKVDAALLNEAPNLRYVATATAGFNHLSLTDLTARGIHWYSAGGCNARAVAEYVLACLYVLAQRDGFLLSNKTVAVVGVGNVGSTLKSLLQSVGIKVIAYDPPRATRDPAFISAEFSQVLKADIISLHTPLVKDGDFPTEHMFDASVLETLGPQQILINACRGEVLDNAALLALMRKDQSSMPKVILDCWEHEPEIDRELLPYITFASAHTAGHSLEGKARGTDMVYADLCRFLSLPLTLTLEDFLPVFSLSAEQTQKLHDVSASESTQTIVCESIKCMYDIENDDSFFRRYMAKSHSFSELRRNYHVRREWPAAKIAIQNKKAASVLGELGFKLANDSK